MNPKPHIVFFLVEIDGWVLFVHRGLYVGFPGSEIQEAETVEVCARRTLSTLGIVTSMGKITHALGCESCKSCKWDGRPASFDIFSLSATVMMPPRGHAFTMGMKKDRRHDEFVKTFLHAPRKIISPSKSSSRNQLAA